MKAPEHDLVAPESLILDYNLYPRHQIDRENLRRISNAREAGATLPPVLADRKSRRVIDGFHRVTDAVRAKLPEIAVLWRNYKTEADMLADAVELNMHGRQLAPYDMARCVQLAEQLSLSKERLAQSLHLTIEKLTALELRKTAIGPDSKLMPIKATLEDFAGTKLTGAQVRGNQQAGGMYPLAYVNQVIGLLENDLIDLENDRLMRGLKKLRQLLNEFLRAQRAEAANS